jgi:tryptophanyl-tRNA synthetase
LEGARKARAIATPLMAELRHEVGLRSLAFGRAVTKASNTAKVASAAFKQYRESDGKFYFKLVSGKGETLLQSTGFTAPKDAGIAIAQLLRGGASELEKLQSVLVPPNASSISDIASALLALGQAD